MLSNPSLHCYLQLQYVHVVNYAYKIEMKHLTNNTYNFKKLNTCVTRCIEI